MQRLTLDFAGRTEMQIAKAWVDKMVAAIHIRDHRHLITVGAIPWAMTWATAKPLFYSPEVSQNLDFVSLHFYPKKDEVKKALTALAVYEIGKPIVIEETFPLNCSIPEMDQFIDGSRPLATGWISFYWGKGKGQGPTEEHKNNGNDDLIRSWLEYFVNKTPEIMKARAETNMGNGAFDVGKE